VVIEGKGGAAVAEEALEDVDKLVGDSFPSEKVDELVVIDRREGLRNVHKEQARYLSHSSRILHLLRQLQESVHGASPGPTPKLVWREQAIGFCEA
jgi:hypothetical protein